jgi:2',3'-cyclic-nucleotide 2'-phosphodiesterase (5'-nucleotidase family)
MRIGKAIGTVLWVAWIGLGGCEVFNESCPVTTPEVWGKGLTVDLDIRQEFVRQCEAPVGDFLADGFRMYPYSLRYQDQPVTVRMALINAGAIRDEVACGEAGSKRDRIPQGPITDQDVYQLLPFYEDSVVIVRMSGSQIKRVLERSVSALTLSGEEGQEGHFLQISGERGVQVAVDCGGAAQTLTNGGKDIGEPGTRIVDVCLGREPCVPIADTGIYFVATLDFLVGTDDQGVPNDGFVGFHYAAPGEEEPVIIQTYLPVIDVVRYWLVNYEDGLRAEYPEQIADQILAAGYPAVEQRLKYTDCGLEGVCGAPSD